MDEDQISERAAKVFAETAFHAGMGVQRVLRHRPLIFEPDARTYWLDKHAVSIPRALQAGNDWERVRTVVTKQSERLGYYAAVFALADAEDEGPVTIRRSHVKDASAKISASEQCEKAREPESFGAFCE